MNKRIASLLAVVMLASSCAASLAACGKGSEELLTSSTKPALPDEQMQTAEMADVAKEITYFREALLASENGQYQAYYYNCDEREESGHWGERGTNGEYLGTVDTASRTYKAEASQSAAYSGIRNDTYSKGAFTSCYYYSEDSSTDSTNPNLSYLNTSRLSDYRHTTIQKDTELYLYEKLKHKDVNGEEYESSEALVSYVSDSSNFQAESKSNYYLTAEYPAINRTFGSVIGINRICYEISKSYNYVNSNYDKFQLFAPMEGDELMFGEFDVVGFDLTVKKNDTKLYVSTKYTIDFQQYTYDYSDGSGSYRLKSELNVEYALLIDLGTPSSLTAFSTNGKDISKVTLNSSAADYAYLDITSEQLTQAVKEGRTITVDIIGGGDSTKLMVCDITSAEIPVVDGKVTIDGAAIKRIIDLYSSMGNTYSLRYYYSPDEYYTELDSFVGQIKIDYTGE